MALSLVGAIASSAALQPFQLSPNSQGLVPVAGAQLIFLLLLLYYLVMQVRDGLWGTSVHPVGFLGAESQGIAM